MLLPSSVFFALFFAAVVCCAAVGALVDWLVLFAVADIEDVAAPPLDAELFAVGSELTVLAAVICAICACNAAICVVNSCWAVLEVLPGCASSCFNSFSYFANCFSNAASCALLLVPLLAVDAVLAVPIALTILHSLIYMS